MRENVFIRRFKKIDKKETEVEIFKILNARLEKCGLSAVGKTLFMGLLQEKDIFKIEF